MSWDFDRDFLKVPRGLVELLRDDPQALTTYVALLARAAWRGSTVMTKHGPVHLRRGQAICGRIELASICGSSERATRRTLTVLQTIQAVGLQTSPHGTIVTILGYDGSPSCDPADVQQADKPPSPPAANAIASSATKVPSNLDLRSEKEDPDAARARAHDPTTPAPTTKPATSDAPSRKVYQRTLDRLNAARLDIAGRFGLSARRIHDQDHKTQAALLPLITASPDFEADFEHVLQIRIAEAIGTKPPSVRWLSGSMFEPGAWRIALAMTLGDVERDTEAQELAFTPVREEDYVPDFSYQPDFLKAGKS